MKDEAVGTIVGLATVSFTNLITGAAHNFLLGFAGALGGWVFARLVKLISKKFTEKKDKK